MQTKYNNASYINGPTNQLQNELLWTVKKLSIQISANECKIGNLSL